MRRIVPLLVIGLTVAGCGGKQVSHGTTSPVAAAPPVTAEVTTVSVTINASGDTRELKLPTRLVTGYLASCTAGSKTNIDALCGCTLVELTKIASQREIRILAEQGRTPPATVQAKLKRATATCRAKLK